jgi:PAS domain S-box-containing protein
MKIKNHNIKYLLIFTFVFIFLFSSICLIITDDKKNRINNILKTELKDINILMKFILDDFKLSSYTRYELLQRDKHFLSILKQYNDDNIDKNKLREQLIEYISPIYKRLQKKGVINLNLITSKSTVMLRMHKQDKFGDNLKAIRKSIRYVSKNKKTFIGFEQGRFKHAYRYVYPLFDENNELLGMVDFGFSTKYIQNLFTKSLNIHSHFLINKKLFLSKVNIEDKLDYNYIPSIEHRDYVFATTDNKNIFDVKKQHENIIKPLKEDIDENIQIEKEFSLYSINNNKAIIVSFLSIKNSKLNNIAYFVSYRNNSEIINLYNDYKRLIFSAFIAILVFVVFLYKNFTNKEKLRKQVDEKTKQILEQKEIFELLYRKSSDGIILLNKNRFIDCNEAALKLFNIKTKREFLALNIFKIFDKDQGYGVPLSQKLKKTISFLSKSRTATSEWKCKKQDGAIFWVDIVLTKIKQNEKDIIHAVLRDITDRKLLELEVEEKSLELATEASKLHNLNSTLENRVKEEVTENRRKEQYLLHQSRLAQMGEMISMIAHQWRQPLTAISATTNNLSLKLMFNELDNKILKKEIDLISGYAQHLSQTIDEFRNFFKDTKVKEDISLESVIHSTLDIVNKSLDNKKINIDLDFKCNKTINTYPTELKQVVLNLIKNAEDILVELDIEKPEIKIETSIENNKKVLKIKDNAGGVPNDIIDKIFDPYFSTKIEKDGTGLGLYMSKIIIEDHCKGKIYVQNDEFGAVFIIELD